MQFQLNEEVLNNYWSILLRSMNPLLLPISCISPLKYIFLENAFLTSYFLVIVLIEPFLGNVKGKISDTFPTEFNMDIASDISKIKVSLPAMLCAGREERVRVTAVAKEVRQIIRVELTKKGHARSERVAITHNDKDGCCLLIVKPKEEGEHLLSITVSGQHVPNSPFLLPVNNRDYYRSTFKQPVQTIDIRHPNNIAFSSNGDMFVTSDSTYSIHVYDKHGQKKMEIGKSGEGRAGVQLSSWNCHHCRSGFRIRQKQQ